jgi:hypothetical protein
MDDQKKLRNAGLRELQSILVQDLACPIDWEKEQLGPVEGIFLRKWYYTVADHLPNGTHDAELLLGDMDTPLTAPSDDSFEYHGHTADELQSLAFNTARWRDSYQRLYRAACDKFVGLRAQPVEERDKHYAKKVGSIDALRKQSKDSRNVGLLLPNFHPEAQRQFFWEAVANAFEDFLMQDDETGLGAQLSERESFDKAWDKFLTPDHYRLCVDTLTTVGFYNGKEARWLVYDVSYHGKIVHCYPALAPVESFHETTLDNLQGLDTAFADGRTDWP